MTAKQETILGKLVDENTGRDAIHVACAPVKAVSTLYPGQHVGLVDGGADVCTKSIGIVDPFLTHPVYPGQYFYICLYPQTITSLRHEWTHPAFKVDERRETIPAVEQACKEIDSRAARLWMEEFARKAGVDYDTVMEGAKEYLDSGWAYVQQGDESMRDAIYEVTAPVFWKNYSAITGVKVTDDEDSPFCCSC